MARMILDLSVKRRLWRGNDDAFESSDAAYAEIRPQVLRRDNFTCSYCGYRAQATEVHHVDDDHSNNAMPNLAVACPLCHAVNHIGQIAKRRGGVLVYLPEISQINLNHLLRTIFIQGDTDAGKQPAKRLLAYLLRRKAVCEQYLGTSSPLDLAEALLRLHPDDYVKRQRVLSPIRIVFNPSAFLTHTRTWADTVYKAYPFGIWNDVARKAEERIASGT